ncbi:hypothetical protein DMUE_0486 [Dictyocoela muelleri]|nr:hypothetical protein DMUE_0486 [Dictyocoela muelleri]
MDIKCGTKFFEVFNSVEFEVELRFVQNYYFLPTKIRALESSLLSTESQIMILYYCLEKCHNDDFLGAYLDASLLKNPDIQYFLNFNGMRGKREDKIFNFIQLNSASVERAFSSYRNIFSDKRQSF